jgi:hypothetical protein
MRDWRSIRNGADLRGRERLGLQLTHPDFVSHVGARPGRRDETRQLTLEVTESVLMNGIENAISTSRRFARWASSRSTTGTG